MEENGYFVDDDGEECEEVVCSDLEDLSQDNEDDNEDIEDQKDAIVPIKDDSTISVSLHKGSVFSISVSPHQAVACSGGEDDVALVWNVDTGQVLFQCEGHGDSVTCTSFSRDGKFLATADMAGLVKVWASDSGQLVWSFEVGEDIEWLKWHSHAPILFVGASSGTLWMWKIPAGDTKTFIGEGSSKNLCGVLVNEGKHMFCGYENGGVKLLDLKSGSSMASLCGLSDFMTATPTTRSGNEGHSGPVLSMCANSEGSLVITGSADGTSKLINSTSGKVVCMFSAGFPSEGNSDETMELEDRNCESASGSVEAVCFSPVFPVAVTGSLSGVIGVWDISTHKLRQQCMQKSQYQSELAGVTGLCSAHREPLVYSGGVDGVVRLWDLRSGLQEREWHGHSGSILDMELLLDGRRILSASDDGTVKIFSYNDDI